MIRRRESAFDGAMECKVRILLSLREEELPTGNELVTATRHNDNTQMADIRKLLEIDIPSGDGGHVQA